MARRGGQTPADQYVHNDGSSQQQRRLEQNCSDGHRVPPDSRAFFRSALSRLYSASDSGSSAASSRAAIAELAESLKKVCRSCRIADRLASSGFATGKYTNRGPSYSRARSPRSIMMSSSFRTLDREGGFGSSERRSSTVARRRLWRISII